MNELKAMLAMHVIAEQLRSGLKHPSPALISEAVDIAEAVCAEIDKRAVAKSNAAEPPAPAPTPLGGGAAPVAAVDPQPS